MAQGAGEGVAGPSTVGPPDTSTLVISDLNLTDESVSKRYNDLLAKRNDLTRCGVDASDPLVSSLMT